MEDEDVGAQVSLKRQASITDGSSLTGHGHKKLKKKSQNSTTSSTVSPLQTRKSELAKTRQQLPVYKFKKEINDYLSKHDVLLVVAETGSGKSTQIPAYLDESGLFSSKKGNFGRSICVTQPRRVAAVTVAKRVAEERGCAIGTAVGYRVRFDDCTERTTRIIYATDGMLLRESMSDPLLTRYSVVVLDESHERSLQTDILFGVVSRAMAARGGEVKRNSDPEEGAEETVDDRIQRRMREKALELNLTRLKVVVMSATLDIQTFQSFFNDATLVQIPGRLFPVQVVYTKDPQDDYIESALATAIQIHEEADEGDVLVFLPGREEIEDLASLLRRHLDQENTLQQAFTSDIVQAVQGMGTNLDGKVASIINGVMICVLYAALPPEAQMIAFQPKPAGCSRKIILATNIAETSGMWLGLTQIIFVWL
jgi:HrpA-like RNA helicase